MTVESRDHAVLIVTTRGQIYRVDKGSAARGKGRAEKKLHHHMLLDVSYAFFGTFSRTSIEICKSKVISYLTDPESKKWLF